MPKLLFFDIDGTLFDDDTHKLPASVVPALNKAKENDCLLFINTGRTLCNMDKQLEQLPLDGISFGCGTRVVCGGRTLKALEFDRKATKEFVEIYRSLNIATVYECDTALYYDPQGPDHPLIPKFREYTDMMGNGRDITDDDEEFRAVKMFCFIEEDRVREALLTSLSKTGHPFYAIDRSNTGWEIVPEGCTKATGIELIRQELGVKLEDCYVFGDSRNDLSMLTHVKNSVAMGQAPDDVKALCSYVTDTPINDGIKKALEALKLI